MAINQQIVDRYKAEGFYKHVEWNRRRGILVKLFDQKVGEKVQTVSFEGGTFDIEYDQYLPGFRQFFLERRDAVKFMLNLGMDVKQIAYTFKMVDGAQVVFHHIENGAFK